LGLGLSPGCDGRSRLDGLIGPAELKILFQPCGLRRERIGIHAPKLALAQNLAYATTYFNVTCHLSSPHQSKLLKLMFAATFAVASCILHQPCQDILRRLQIVTTN
jgi:hypothetical protein